MDDFKRVLKISGVYIGTIIGAGFASGREIISFFLVYGKKWTLGMLLCGVLFALTGCAVMEICRKRGIGTYKGFMEYILGPKAGPAMEWVSGIFLCVLFFAMTSAAGAIAKEAFGMSGAVGTAALLLSCFFVFLFDVKGVVAVNAVLAPLLILAGIFIGVHTIMSGEARVFSLKNSFGWIFSSLLYVSYNLISVIPVLVPMKDLSNKKTVSRNAGVLTGAAIAFLGAAMAVILYTRLGEVAHLQIPMLAVTSGEATELAYKFLLIAAVFTTAVGNGFGALKWLESKCRLRGVYIKLMFIIAAAAASAISFTGFVSVVYPFFGYLGLFELICIVLIFAAERRN